jgi:hypothetical protein
MMHPAAEWGSLTGSWQLNRQEALWDNEPCTGEVPPRVASPLADVLARFTTTAAQCWFAPTAMRDRCWMLFMSDTASAQEKLAAREAHEARVAERERVLASAPRFKLPHREFLLFYGPMRAVHELYGQIDEGPNLWWPEDHRWCVGTDLDLMTSYVGGSRECIEALLGDERLEVLAVSVDQGVTWEADTINPLPGTP